MLPRRAERFAAVSLWMHAEKGTFEIGLEGERDPDSIVEAFQQAGCTVHRDDGHHRLIVTYHGERPEEE